MGGATTCEGAAVSPEDATTSIRSPSRCATARIYVDVHSGGSKRKDAHFLLLKEGLLSEDNWTLSKAIAIMLAKGVSEKDTLQRVAHHMGRHIATGRSPTTAAASWLCLSTRSESARQYAPDDRLIPLMMAATGASGRAGDRPEVQPLPPPVTWEKLATGFACSARTSSGKVSRNA